MYISKGIWYSFVVSVITTVIAQTEDHQRYEPEYIQDGVIEDLTFGAHGNIWAKDHRHITGWSISGQAYTPELLSDRIILTPPYPGNKRGAIWADHVEDHDEWEAEFEFRASGPERGNGNFQMWFAKDPKKEIGTASLYTVGKFDGLVLAIGQYLGHGTLRAFLNDGSISFKDHPHIDQLAFAQCDFNYRNLGRFSHVAVKQTQYTFEVQIDHFPCIQTHKIHLPHGYYYGLTAASAENPDSFEAKSFIVHKLKGGTKIESPGHGKHPEGEKQWNDHAHWLQEVQDSFIHDAESSGALDSAPMESDTATSQNHDYHRDNRGWYWTTEKESAKDTPASTFKTEAERFEDLHSRISTINKQLDILFHDLTTFKRETEERHISIMHYNHALADHNKILLEKILLNIEGRDYKETLDKIHDTVREGNQAVLVDMPQAVHSMVKSSSPRFGFFVFLVVACQVMLLGSYMIYKRRIKNQPKKYL